MAEQWRATEIELTSALDHTDPYADVDVTFLFEGPDGARVVREAFWDGGRSWRVRFAPTRAGVWHYTTRSSASSDSGLHDRHGELTCSARPSALPIYHHGFIGPSADGRNLQHDDGSAFFWLGDTHWRFAWEEFDKSNKPGWSSQFRDTVDLRVRQGFTVYQSNLLSWTPPPFWQRLSRNREFDVTFFQEVVDPRMAYIANSGLVHALGLGWYHTIDANPRAMVKLARYIVARYGAYPMVWTLAGEVAGYEPESRTARLNAWRDVALAVRSADDYQHPLTAHLTNERPMPADFQNEEWLTFTLSQLGHGDMDMASSHWSEHLAAFPGKPLIEGEAFYEGLTSVEPTGRRRVTDTMVRQVAYRAMQSGCCGFSYGGQGCWNGAWDTETSASMWGELAWFEGVELQGATQMGHMRRFYESLEWTALSPASDVYDSRSWVNSSVYRPHVSATPARETLVVYFGETYRWDEPAGRLQGLPLQRFDGEWFDPRTADRITAFEDELPVDGAIDIPQAPSSADWILLVSTHRGR